MRYSGGYLVHREPLVKSSIYKHTADDLSKISPITLEAVNAVQATPWQINPNVSEVFFSLFTDPKPNDLIRSFIPVRPVLDKLPDEVWEAMSKEDRDDHRIRRRDIRKNYDVAKSEFHETEAMFVTASELSNKKEFYFPHNMDFRTRLYPIPTILNPQSNDLAKGLLRFAEGHPIGAGGHYWLTIAVANSAGQDKLEFDGRALWTLQNEDLLRRVVRDPLKNREWTEMDEPWVFLALAHDYVYAADMDNPHEFVSQVPIQLDGTCNGAQHLSIMARDIVGAEATNCRDMEHRNDLYLDVANRVWAMVQEDVRRGVEVARDWMPKLVEANSRRKVVKRAVMTISYGVTEFGIAQFMIDDGHVGELDKRQQWPAARYMRDCILSSINETLSNGRELQAWFSKCATTVAEKGKPLQWDTPVGSKVTQAYKTLITKTIRTAHGRHMIYEESDGTGMNISKMGLAASPNVVHSCDASHLQLTTKRMADEGIRSFSMIHDSYGTHACHIERMRNILRGAIYDMYRDDYLGAWRESAMRYSGLDLPEPPKRGSFNIEEILRAPYFFA